MPMMMQAAGGDVPLIPWWVLYVAVLGAMWGVFRLARGRGGAAVAVGCVSFVPIVILGVLALPARLFLVTLALGALPAIAAMVGMRGRAAAASSVGGVLPQGAQMARIPAPLMVGQPRAEAVLRSKAMAARYQAGMPRDARFVARVRYVRGIGEMPDQPVDLFMGGGQLWVAPLKPGTTPVPVPARNVLRVDVWPEPDRPPTLRVSWSPPAGDLTADVVMEAMPTVPPQITLGQLQAIAGVLTAAVAAEAREAERAEVAAMEPMTIPPPVPGLRACPNCGETVPPGARACPRCAMPV